MAAKCKNNRLEDGWDRFDRTVLQQEQDRLGWIADFKCHSFIQIKLSPRPEKCFYLDNFRSNCRTSIGLVTRANHSES
jgi:hypothetical protein